MARQHHLANVYPQYMDSIHGYAVSKEGLLVACIRQARAELLRVTSQAAVDSGNPEDMLRNGLVAYFQFIRAHSQSWALLRSEAAVVGPSAAEEIEAVRQQQTDLISGTMALYAPRPAPLDLTPAAEVIVGGCERLALWCERHPETTPETAAELVMQLIWFGMRTIVAQLLTESLVLGTLGGAAGAAVAFWIVRALVLLGPASIPRLQELAVDTNVLGFSVALALVTSVVSGLTPARVIGRNFFTDVGPCTNNYLVAQRYADSDDLDEQLDYVFTFRMAPTPVRLRLLARKGSERQYLAVLPR